jgi:hypothetical protein
MTAAGGSTFVLLSVLRALPVCLKHLIQSPDSCCMLCLLFLHAPQHTSHRYHPEILDALCFPSSLQPADAAEDTAAAGTSSSSKAAAPAFSCLDGLLQLVKQAPQLMSSNPRLLAGVLRVLALLWDCQAAAHGAVDILRAQPDLWTGLKVSRGSTACSTCASLGDDEGSISSSWGPRPVSMRVES